MGFVDDYTRWVVSESVEDNMEILQNEVIPRALEWARGSGAMFEGDKTTLMHFTLTRSFKKIVRPVQALRIGDAAVAPSESAKLLGVVFDSALTFKEHVARAAKRGWRSARALSRLQGIRPATARLLYTATVTPRTDYAAAVWFSPYLGKAIPTWMQRLFALIQRLGTRAITNCFCTVLEEVASSEAYVPLTALRLRGKVTRFWIKAHTLLRVNLM